MAYVTVAEARSAASSEWATKAMVASTLRKSAGAPMSTEFDIFLSHSYEDAEIIGGLRVILEREGLSVYVDWIEDAQADRSRVTPETAEILRQRMAHCKQLIYASSTASTSSKWMPWELGYFDGLRQGHVGILPVVQTPGAKFKGQEYLGLYPEYQFISLERYGRRIARDISETKAARLITDARG
jgi:hypothetical protein